MQMEGKCDADGGVVWCRWRGGVMQVEGWCDADGGVV